MKLKHKKLILIISMSAMGMGLIVFSIADRKSKDTQEVVSVEEVAEVTSEETPTPTQEETETPTPTAEVTEEATEESTQEPTQEITEEPTPTAVVLEEDANEEINTLIKNFLQAKLDGKTKKLKKLVTDSSYIDIELIQKKTEFIESYDNIKVYTMEGTGDIDYIAYVYMEVKIASIDTVAPGMDEYYIKKVDGEYKIVQGDISDETAEYIEEARQSEEVQALLAKVNKKLKKAMKNDEALAEFCNKLDDSSEES